MTIEAARVEIATIAATLVAAHSVYPLVVEYDNRLVVDQVAQETPYLQLQMKYLSGMQMDMAAKPIVGQFGQLLLAVVVKAGTGTKAANDLMDFVVPYFELQKLTLLQLKEFQPTAAITLNGWYYVTGFINFQFYRISA